MSGTYEMIKALPGKGTNWTALAEALKCEYFAAYAYKHDGAAPWDEGGMLADWKVAKGVRMLREVAMQAAAMYVDLQCKVSRFIPPSEETLSWGGFLGGEHVSYRDEDAEREAEEFVSRIIERTALKPA